MSSTTKQQRLNRNQAAKAILTQLYVAWASEPRTMKVLRDKIQEATASATAKGGPSASSPSSPSANKAANGKHADPTRGIGASSSEALRSDSPPVTPPAKGVKGTVRPEDLRASSPIKSSNHNSSGGRFLGVDELDYAHRAGSPGFKEPSQQHHAKPVIDPMAPLPQQHGSSGSGGTSLQTPATGSGMTSAAVPGQPTTSSASSSSAGAHSLGSASLDTSLNAAMVDMMPSSVVDLNTATGSGKEPSVGRFVHSSGGYAVRAPANARRASLSDIPVFYTKKDSKGVMDGLPEDEVARLGELLADKTAGGAGKAVRKAAYGDLSVQVFKVPLWMKNLLFEANAEFVGASPTTETLTPAQVTEYYKKKLGPLTVSRRLFELIRGQQDRTREFLTIEDLTNTVKYLVSAHPALEFLQQPEFQEHYCRTVAIRIMYALERQQNRKVYWRDFDRSDLPDVMTELDDKDVNKELKYFSYEHFYVLYCKYWELDTDRDSFLEYSDLCGYGQGSVVPLAIRRVVDGYGRALTSEEPGRLNFEDFAYFCLSEEDKNSEPAVYYWFKVLDLDGDGILSGYELMEFFKENQQRFLEYSESPEGDIAYEDTMCQMLDMLGFDRIKTHKFGVTLGDLLACPTTANFFNMIINAPKFMLFEHRDPFSEHQQKLRIEKTDWDRFARLEYDHMASEAQ